jgi:ribosomal protein S18 acetylase RimI-like enzyme
MKRCALHYPTLHLNPLYVPFQALASAEIGWPCQDGRVQLMVMDTALLSSASHIRKVNVRQDLLAVADLIEICFASTLDDDGRDYLRQLRWTARDASYVSWLQGAAERLAAPLYGFVWEEDRQIVGNLSLITLYRGGKVYFLIANVAVHPDYRRRGIGRRLTLAALESLRSRGVDAAWLQVRDDNPTAHHMYLSLGFVERARRTTWQASATPPLLTRPVPEGIMIHSRRFDEWEQQLAWLQNVYPPEVAWNLPLNPDRFSPDLWTRFIGFFQGETQQHWTARCGDKPVGFLTWEPMRTASDALWLATSRQDEDQAILALLPQARENLSNRRRPLAVNYPAGRAGEAFLKAGFYHHQTLIWMAANLRTR